jgi:penicillin-binding protein 1A
MLQAAKKWGLRLGIAGAALTLVAVIVGWRLIRHYEEGLPSVAELERGYRPSQVTRVLARDGTTLAELFTERRTIVHIE